MPHHLFSEFNDWEHCLRRYLNIVMDVHLSRKKLNKCLFHPDMQIYDKILPRSPAARMRGWLLSLQWELLFSAS